MYSQKHLDAGESVLSGTLKCHEGFKILAGGLGWGTGRSSKIVDTLQVWCPSASLLQSVI